LFLSDAGATIEQNIFKVLKVFNNATSMLFQLQNVEKAKDVIRKDFPEADVSLS